MASVITVTAVADYAGTVDFADSAGSTSSDCSADSVGFADSVGSVGSDASFLRALSNISVFAVFRCSPLRAGPLEIRCFPLRAGSVVISRFLLRAGSLEIRCFPLRAGYVS